jgi:methyl-accepting chemotaxis protein
VSAAIEGFTGSVAKVRSLADSVMEASQHQRQGIDQVSEAIARMEGLTQRTAATAEESAAASEELNAQAETSLGHVREIAVIVGSAADGRKAVAAPVLDFPVQSRQPLRRAS